MARISIRVLIFSSAFVFASGCLTPQSDAVTGLIAATATTTVTNSQGGDVYLAVDTAWELTPDVFTRHGVCQVAAGSATRTQSCIIHVPEGQLFYSKTKLSFGTANPTLCKRIQFFPAVYQMSNTNTTLAVTNAALDCTGTSLMSFPGFPAVYPVGDKSCFWGPAIMLYSDWPTTIGKYFNVVSSGVNELSETIDSSRNLATTKSVSIDGNYFTNLAVANHIDDTTTDVTSPGGNALYIGNTMSPYRVRCVDDYEQTQAEVLVDIADDDLETGEDPGNANNDQFYDFLETD
jgi:hypothetical protein